MATLGTSLSAAHRGRAVSELLRLLGLSQNPKSGRLRQNGLGTDTDQSTRTVAVLYKNTTGGPSDNTEADRPTGEGDFCINTVDSTVWVCVTYTNTTTFDWVQIK